MWPHRHAVFQQGSLDERTRDRQLCSTLADIKQRLLSQLTFGTITAGEALANHCYFNQGELACLKKLIRKRPSITKQLRRAIGRRRSTTARATTPRPARSQRRLRAIRRPLANIPMRRTVRASRTSKRIQSGVVGEVPGGLAVLFHSEAEWQTTLRIQIFRTMLIRRSVRSRSCTPSTAAKPPTHSAPLTMLRL